MLEDANPDVVCLTEAWATDEGTQAEGLARQLGYEHHASACDLEIKGWTSGFGVVSRWAIVGTERRSLKGERESAMGSALHVRIDGDRGEFDVYAVMLHYPLDGSADRAEQVRQLAEFVATTSEPGALLVVCGDFNAGPDADEVRALTGRRAPPRPGLVFYDAWEIAGDGSPGHTWSNENRVAAPMLYPDRRIDYVLSACPRSAGLGHPTRCALLGVQEAARAELSDHYGVVADLRY